MTGFQGAIIDAVWIGRIVLWLVVSPWLGAAIAVLLRRFPPAALRAAIVVNLLCTAIIATALNVAIHAPANAEHRRGGVIQWTVCDVPRDPQHEIGRPAVHVAQPESPWLEIALSFGCDRLNAPLLLWTAWISLSAILVAVPTVERAASYYGVFCAWQGCLLGCFAAYDALTFLACDAGALCLGFVLLGGWGAGQRRFAAGRFWRHQFAGHVAWWTGLIALGVVTAWCRSTAASAMPTLSWTWHALVEQLPRHEDALRCWLSMSPALFLLLVFGALIRSPVAPLHAWWPPAMSDAPPSVAVVMSAGWCPLGLYAFARFIAPVFGDALDGHSDALAFCGELTAIYAALLAFAQVELRRFAAYSLVSVQGIAWTVAVSGTSAGVSASLALSQAAGISCSAWLMICAILMRSTTPDQFALDGALANRPRLIAAIAILVSCFSGLPVLARGQIDVVVAWLLAATRPLGLLASVAACIMTGWGAVWMLQRMLIAPEPDAMTIQIPSVDQSPDLTWMDALALAPLAAWGIGNWLPMLTGLDARP